MGTNETVTSAEVPDNTPGEKLSNPLRMVLSVFKKDLLKTRSSLTHIKLQNLTSTTDNRVATHGNRTHFARFPHSHTPRLRPYPFSISPSKKNEARSARFTGLIFSPRIYLH
jgi:hypothetical protein